MAAAAETFSSMKGFSMCSLSDGCRAKELQTCCGRPAGPGAIQNSMQDAVEAGRAGKAIVEEADRTTRNWMLSWQTLSRVIQTQIIVRTLNLIRDAFEEAYQVDIKFVSEVSEIRAVDPGPGASADRRQCAVLSDAFNQPLAQVAEAQYQAIVEPVRQDQRAGEHPHGRQPVGEGHRSGPRHGRDARSPAATLTAKSSEMAGMRAAQFFEAVALGHFRLNDLSTALGRNQTIGHELGVEMEELEASMITLSIGGLKANEAATQLRGVMSALLKPFENMCEALHSLGIESGEEAIATWGLMGTLQHLEFGGPRLGLGDGGLVPQRPRSRPACCGSPTKGPRNTPTAWTASTRRPTSSKLKTSFAEFMATDAQKATAELNKLHNYLTTEFGADLVHEMAALTGGTDTLIALIRPLAQDLLLGPARGRGGCLSGAGQIDDVRCRRGGCGRTSTSHDRR